MKFKPRGLKDDFYTSVGVLQLTNTENVATTRIKNLLEGLERFIDVTYTNTNSINKYDILDDSLNYKSIYDKISNLIEDKKIEPRDKFSIFILEPYSLRGVFYARFKYLKLTNYGSAATTRIGNFR